MCYHFNLGNYAIDYNTLRKCYRDWAIMRGSVGYSYTGQSLASPVTILIWFSYLRYCVYLEDQK